MTKEDFKISGDTCLWMIFCILILAIFISYHRGRIDQKVQDDQQWAEDMILGKNIPKKEVQHEGK